MFDSNLTARKGQSRSKTYKRNASGALQSDVAGNESHRSKENHPSQAPVQVSEFKKKATRDQTVRVGEERCSTVRRGVGI